MWNWVAKLAELQAQGRPAVVATVSRVTGSAPREVGAKLIALSDGTFFGTVGGGHMEELILAECQSFFQNPENRTIEIPLSAKAGQCCGGAMEILLEGVNFGPRLFVFGAGHVGQAIARTFQGTAFSVRLVDERPEWLGAASVPSDVIRFDDWEDVVDGTDWSTRDYVVILTHRHDLDQEILEKFLTKPLAYLGLIGSKSKWLRFRQRLEPRGFAPADLARVRCPIGLPTGGKAPQEVAVSLAAELLSLHYLSHKNALEEQEDGHEVTAH